MRGAFFRTLTELARRDPRILLLTGDLGYMAVEPFADEFPDRFVNVGVAEQNMVGLATGLAEAGFIPFVYSIVPFAVLRPYEFIRNGPIQHRLAVRIVGMGAGFDYGNNGLSHYGLEDIAVLRAQPGITLISPADHRQTREALLAGWDLPGPVYFRLGKDDRTEVPGLDGRFEIGRAQELRDGTEALLVVMGSVAAEAASAADRLASEGIPVRLLVVASVEPPPVDDLVRDLGRFPLAVTIEAHSVTGGLGSLVSELAAERALLCRVVRCGVRMPIDGTSGSRAFHHERHGLSADTLASTVRRELGRPAP